MKGVSVNKKKTQVLNNAGEADTTVEIVSESRKRNGDGGFGSEDGGGGRGESIFREIGDKRRTEDGEEDEEEDEDEDDGGEGYEEEGEGGQEERPKLDEGFFEIEAIRRKRVRKGKFQYLIKWRGWPETANTWEPLENLQSIADVVDAFEGSLKPGKRGRKPKHKYGGPHSHLKKKQQQHLSTTSLDTATGKYESSTSLNNSTLPDIPGTVDLSGSRDGEAKNAYASYQVEANSGSVEMVRQVSLIEEEKEYDPTLNELRGPVGNSNNAGGIGSESDNVRTNGFLKVYPKELDKNTRGAQRRKSSSVKRFKQDESTTSNNHLTITDPNQTQDLTALDSFGKTKTQELDIIKILKPMSFTASVSDNVQEVLVSFSALRSDGKEVTVDNRFLKAHNPLLLIEYYEQHLKYNRTF